MTEGVTLEPGEGHRIVGGSLDVTVKVAGEDHPFAATFEVVVPPGYDVGAHVHSHGQEVFYVVEGEIDILAFEPTDRSTPDWHRWESRSGRRYLHGKPGAFMFVPENTPHAFANTSTKPAKMFFQSSVPGGHDNYFVELAALLRRSGGQPDNKAIQELRQRYDIEQLTSLRTEHTHTSYLRAQGMTGCQREHRPPQPTQLPLPAARSGIIPSFSLRSVVAYGSADAGRGDPAVDVEGDAVDH